MFRRLKDYLEDAQYLEEVSSPEHGPLMTKTLEAKILVVELAITFASLIGIAALVVYARASGLNMEDDLTGLGIPSLTAPAGLVIYLGWKLAQIVRAVMVWREFDTVWKDRSFHIPVARAFF